MEVINLGVADGLPPVSWGAVVEELGTDAKTSGATCSRRSGAVTSRSLVTARV